MENNKTKRLSVSTLIAKFFPEFDAEAAAENIASRTGVTTAEVLQNWKKASEKGNEFSQLIRIGWEDEQVLEKMKEDSILQQDGFLKTVTGAVLFLKNYKKIEFEQNITNCELHGRIDAIAEKNLIEFKFGKITFSNDFAKMKKPFEKFDASKLNKHLLQICIYIEILQNLNIDIEKSHIVGGVPTTQDNSTFFNISICKNEKKWECDVVDFDNLSNVKYYYGIVTNINKFLDNYFNLNFLKNYENYINIKE